MAGLLGDVLPYLYSRGDALKRQVNGLLSDPVGSAQQTLGLLADKSRENQNMLAQAFQDPSRPFRVTDQGALGQASTNVLSGLLGFAPAGMMAGVGAKTANRAALSKAEAMEKQGASADTVWRETGWGRGQDGKWRFEIDDSGAKFEPSFVNAPPEAMNAAVGDVLDHPELFKAYPSIANSPFGFYPHASNPMYFPAQDKVVLPGGRGEAGLSNMLHELQHAIQQREGFAKGGSYGGDWSKYDEYMGLPGEVEARIVQDRMRLTPEQRRAKPPR